jgi:broad specificity phosphatase PhoE
LKQAARSLVFCTEECDKQIQISFTAVAGSMQPLLTLYLARHGETTANRDGILQGQTDYPLSDTGVAQAAVLAERLAAVDFDLLWSSDLSRAADTAAAIVSKQPNPQGAVQLTPLLREFNLGVLETLPRSTSRRAAIAIKAATSGLAVADYAVPPSESMADIVSRAQQFLKMLVDSARAVAAPQQQQQQQTLQCLAVSHGGFIHAALTVVMGVQELRSLGNCSLSVVDIFETDEANGAVVYMPQLVNDTSHLDALGISSSMAVENLLQEA